MIGSLSVRRAYGDTLEFPIGLSEENPETGATTPINLLNVSMGIQRLFNNALRPDSAASIRVATAEEIAGIDYPQTGLYSWAVIRIEGEAAPRVDSALRVDEYRIRLTSVANPPTLSTYLRMLVEIE